MTIEEVQRELEKAAANARRPYVLAQKANLARLEQLVADAEAARDREMAGGNVKGERFYEALEHPGQGRATREIVGERELEGR